MMQNTRISVTLATTLCSFAVWAGSPTGSAQNAGDVGQSTPNQSMENDAGALQEIVVTAQRRSESLQKVPIAVTALSAATLSAQGVIDTQDLATVTPSLDFSTQLHTGTPFLRGIGTTNGSPGNEPSVATFVDGVYYASPAATLFSLNNIEQIEILRGPQGTLFGRNATGGVIQVTTRDPGREPTLEASMGYGNYRTVESTVYASMPIADNLAADLATYYRRQYDGWGRNVNTGQQSFDGDDVSLRSKWLYTGMNTKVRVILDYSQSRGETGETGNLLPGSIGLDGRPRSGGYYDTTSGMENDSITKTGGVSVDIQHDFGAFEVRSISAFRRLHSDLDFDYDLTPLPILGTIIKSDDETITQEVQMLSPESSRIRWIVGVFYLHDKASYDPFRFTGEFASPLPYLDTYGYQITNSYSGFGQVTLPITQKLNITGGIRYTLDNRSIKGYDDYGGTFQGYTNPVSGQLVPGAFRASKDFPKTTYRVALDYALTENVLAYGSVSRGFKSGTFNTNSPTDPPVRPEVLDDYEVGLKNEFLDRKVRLNVDGFFYNYKDIQVEEVINGPLVDLNAAKAQIYGVEAELDAAVTSHFTIQGGFSYLHGRYTSFPNAPFYTPNPAGGNNLVDGDASGNVTIHTPRFKTHLGGTYKIDTPIGQLELAANYAWTSRFYWDPNNEISQAPYSIVNSSLGWTSSDSRFGVKLWVRNALNEHYATYAIAAGNGNSYAPSPPATYGITFNVKLL